MEKYLIYIGTEWKNISKHPNLPEDFIDEYFYYLKPYRIESTQTLSPYLLIKYQENLNWQLMSKTQDLPEFLIEKHRQFVNWNWISEFQKLSLKFIIKYSNYLSWKHLTYNKNILPNILILAEKYFKK